MDVCWICPGEKYERCSNKYEVAPPIAWDDVKRDQDNG